MRPSLHLGRRGQALVLLCLTVILLAVMACITVSIAVRTRERLEQQTLSDTIAYSNAVASARAYNTLSLINRTALAHWVSLMAVQANVSWSTLHKAWFEALADAVGTFDPPGAPGNACAAQRQQEIKAARHSLIHAALSSYNAPNASNDDVNLRRDHPAGCSLFDERSPNWRGRNFGQDDVRVAQETRRIYEALDDLTAIQSDIYVELEQRVKGGQVASDLVKLSRGDGSMGPYRLLDGAPGSGGPAWEHVSHAVGRSPSDSDQVRRDSLVPLAHAAMGARPSGYLVGGSDEDPPAANGNRVKPPWTLSVTREIQDDLNAHFRPGTFGFHVEHFAVRSYLGEQPRTPPGMGRVHAGRDLGFGNVAGGAWARLHVTYRGPCNGFQEKWVWPNAEMMLNRVGTSEHAFGYAMAAIEDPPPPASQWSRGHASVGEGLTAGHQAYYGNVCHPGHRHWGEIHRDNHHLQGPQNPSIWPRGFGFVFPQNRAEESSFPAFGQPTLPVLLARSYRPGDVVPDPWNLTVRMRFSSAGPGSTFDMAAGRVSPDQAAMSTAILYYHRRRPVRAGRNDDDSVGSNGWVESPNLLNPYWHATLVRSDLGERVTPTQPTERPILQRTQYQMLRDEGFTSAAEAYRELEAAGFKSWQ